LIVVSFLCYFCSINKISGVDNTNAIGLLGISTNHCFVGQITAFLVDAGSVLLLASAKSLYVLINKPMPKIVKPLIYGCAGLHQALTLTESIAEVRMQKNKQENK